MQHIKKKIKSNVFFFFIKRFFLRKKQIKMYRNKLYIYIFIFFLSIRCVITILKLFQGFKFLSIFNHNKMHFNIIPKPYSFFMGQLIRKGSASNMIHRIFFCWEFLVWSYLSSFSKLFFKIVKSFIYWLSFLMHYISITIGW